MLTNIRINVGISCGRPKIIIKYLIPITLIFNLVLLVTCPPPLLEMMASLASTVFSCS